MNPQDDDQDEGPEFVICPECGNEQADMGNSVVCENCGYGPMPYYKDGYLHE
jgi:hypothetical protein